MSSSPVITSRDKIRSAKRIHLNDQAGKLVQVVGVSRMSKYLWITENKMDFVYLPLAQNPQSSMALLAQSKNMEPAALVPVLRQVVASLDRNMPIYDVRTMKSLYESRAVATPNIITRTVGGMGVMGLVLSIIGLYGVVSYSVSRRTREFGIRMAVGADRRKVVIMVLRQGLWLAAAGILFGLAVGDSGGSRHTIAVALLLRERRPTALHSCYPALVNHHWRGLVYACTEGVAD